MIIDKDKCTGCGQCMDVCEYEAIEGAGRYGLQINQEVCTGCGSCADLCHEGAIE